MEPREYLVHIAASQTVHQHLRAHPTRQTEGVVLFLESLLGFGSEAYALSSVLAPDVLRKEVGLWMARIKQDVDEDFAYHLSFIGFGHIGGPVDFPLTDVNVN
jgi:hypothetical protein